MLDKQVEIVYNKPESLETLAALRTVTPATYQAPSGGGGRNYQ